MKACFLTYKIRKLPWLVWLSGLSTGLETKGSLVRFLVRSHAWVAGWVPGVPGGGAGRRQPQTDVSLPFFLPPCPSPKIK